MVIGACVTALGAYAAALRSRMSARTGYFIAGLAVFFATLSSPLNALAGGYLFSAHMLQHMLLLLIVPPLILLGFPTLADEAESAWARFRLHPLLAWLGGVGAMWVWHERTLCDLATRTETFAVIQNISLLTLGALFWWPIVGPVERQRVPPLTGVVYLFSACVACSVLGILITFAPIGGVCPIFFEPPARPEVVSMIRTGWGITPLQDQQIGGLLMWVPGCLIYLTGVMGLLARWYRSPESEGSPVRQPASMDVPKVVSTRARVEGR